jgi:hypothetical protein
VLNHQMKMAKTIGKSQSAMGVGAHDSSVGDRRAHQVG